MGWEADFLDIFAYFALDSCSDSHLGLVRSVLRHFHQKKPSKKLKFGGSGPEFPYLDIFGPKH